MVFSKSLAVASAVSAVSPFAHAFNAQAKSNIAVYWGQGDNQARLSHFCQDTSLDIINIGFVNIFPDQGAANWPGSNFGNQCNGLTYEIGGVKTELLSGCHQIMEDIPICQAAGKKVLLSLGGATPDNQKILSTKSAIGFAEFLWASFGPVDDAWVAWGGPRPFGNVSVDGFDFDIEHNGGFGYASMVTRFRELFAEKPDQKFYLSGSPQCHLPDKQLGLAIATSAFDFVWVQFYNNDDCSARNFVGGEGFNFDAWVDIIKSGGNPDAKLFVGLPGSKAAALDGYYLPPDEVKPLASKYMKLYPDTFGGIMVWEATQSDRNQINGTSYAGNMKRILTELDPTPPAPTTPPSSSPNVSSTPIRSSTPVSSLTPSPSTTPAQSSTPVASSTSLVSSTPVRSSTPIVSSAPAHSGTASSTPLMSSSPVHSTTPVHFSTPLIPSTSTRSSSPATLAQLLQPRWYLVAEFVPAHQLSPAPQLTQALLLCQVLLPTLAQLLQPRWCLAAQFTLVHQFTLVLLLYQVLLLSPIHLCSPAHLSIQALLSSQGPRHLPAYLINRVPQLGLQPRQRLLFQTSRLLRPHL
ncbi:class III chitinase ChiA1 [Aspergillus alliaceus]|uniref:class III chitinase ChiA1 n=1 Tax=Petromyces alliaceus TaxID=209559 RepID=UPI0012A5ABFA|nr:glycoside hydrolase superfamily [Aspergillus alliaceus]KAB8234681.1 glycoside hydrolase superfamily [Aspergillus alliaceus]